MSTRCWTPSRNSSPDRGFIACGPATRPALRLLPQSPAAQTGITGHPPPLHQLPTAMYRTAAGAAVKRCRAARQALLAMTPRDDRQMWCAEVCPRQRIRAARSPPGITGTQPATAVRPPAIHSILHATRAGFCGKFLRVGDWSSRDPGDAASADILSGHRHRDSN